MRSSLQLVLLALFSAAAATAASVDMNDPRRALGREDNVRVDAQLHRDEVSSGSSIGVVYQVENLTAQPIAVAHKVADCSYDPETQVITLAVGSEVPANGTMPQMTLIAPGEKKTFSASALLRVNLPSVRSPFVSVPRYVQVKVNILREIEPFVTLIAERAKSTVATIALTDAQFDRWLESNDAIFLNTIPVRWNPKSRSSATDASRRGAETGSF